MPLPHLVALPLLRRWLPALSMLLALLAAWSALAQAPSARQGPPYRTMSEGAHDRLMLEGHDPVAYFTRNDAVRGDPAITVEHDGVVFRFASEEHKAQFQQAPGRYMPQFGGFCSNGINYAIPWGGGGGPNTWRIYRGKLYVFGGQSSRDHFEMDTERNLELAQRLWDEEVADSWALFQRFKRLVFRVPHYKTGKQLDDEYREKLAAKTLPVMPGAPQVVPRD